MARYHVNPDTGRPNLCRAQSPESCLYYNAETNTEAPHFDNKIDARKYIEKEMNQEYKETKTLTKIKQKENPQTENDKISYSFLKKYEELEKEYSDFPNKFLKKDLRKMGNKTFLAPAETDEIVAEALNESIILFKEKYKDNPNIGNLTDDDIKERILSRNATYGSREKLYPFITNVITEPKEHSLSDSDLEKYAKNLGIKNLQRFENPEGLGKKYGDVIYTGEIENVGKDGNITTTTIFIADAPLNSKNFGRRAFKSSNLQSQLRLKGYSTWADRRALAGAHKILKHTNENILSNNQNIYTKYLNIVKKLEEKQDDVQNFNHQKDYIKNTNGTIATVWDEKKNPDKTHQKLMKETSLNKIFKNVEIDNAVSPEEYKDFEKAYHEVQSKLPKIPSDRKPTLKLRFLGKHKATGLFAPMHNTVAIDVRDSGSTIHELAHYYDFMLKDNISINAEFNEIKKEYAKNLKMPKEISANSKYGADYYNTNTEVHSRLFEIWAYERKGINNRLLNKDKFKEFDYAPIMNNPELKKKGFEFLDKVYG